MTPAFCVIAPWDVQPGLRLSHQLTRWSTYQTIHWCCQHQRCVAFSLASSRACPAWLNLPGVETPDGIASEISEARKSPDCVQSNNTLGCVGWRGRWWWWWFFLETTLIRAHRPSTSWCKKKTSPSWHLQWIQQHSSSRMRWLEWCRCCCSYASDW